MVSHKEKSLHAAFEKEKKKEQRSNRIGIFESLCLWEMQNMCPIEWRRLAVRSTTHKSALCSVTISSFLILFMFFLENILEDI